MHKSVQQATIQERGLHRASDKKLRRCPNFIAGDFVLVGIPEKKPNQKLFLKWRGPFKIVEPLSSYVFEVENLVTQKRYQVHGDRLLFYCDSKLNVTEELKTQFAFDNATFEIERIMEARQDTRSGDLDLLISWKGFSHLEDWSQLSSSS